MNEIKQKYPSILTIAITFLVMAVGIYYLMSMHWAQQENLANVDRYIESVLNPLLKKNPAFTNVKVGGYTGGQGMLAVAGSVETKDELDKLRLIIKKSSPPRPIKWLIRVIKNQAAAPTPHQENTNHK